MLHYVLPQYWYCNLFVASQLSFWHFVCSASLLSQRANLSPSLSAKKPTPTTTTVGLLQYQYSGS